MTGFGLTVQRLGGDGCHVAVHGALDIAHAPRFDAAVRGAERGGCDPIVIDLSDIEFVDPTGLGRLISARRRSHRAGWRLVLVRGPAAVQRLFSAVALEDLFEFVPTAAEAVAQEPASTGPASPVSRSPGWRSSP
ncbi:MAG TPA: STAS domain-containing protein [Capillimicrobium sp.]|jgi:anti-anti-sigma factor